MIQAEKDIILNDKMLQGLTIQTQSKYSNIYQSDMPETTIIKSVYNTHNTVFCNREQKKKPSCRCVFTLHTSKKSSYVQIFDRENKEIFSGNSLWGNSTSKTESEHLMFIKLLHSVEDVIENYGGEVKTHHSNPKYLDYNSSKN